MKSNVIGTKIKFSIDKIDLKSKQITTIFLKINNFPLKRYKMYKNKQKQNQETFVPIEITKKSPLVFVMGSKLSKDFLKY